MPKTYCTYRIKVANRERVQVEKWNSLHQSLGDPSGAFRYLEKLDELTPQLSSASNNELNDSIRVRTLGETLFDILFDDVLWQDFVGFYEQVVHQDKQLLRIELVIDEKGMPEVAALPWEFMCLPERANLGTIWLSTASEVVFSRRRSQYFAAEPIQLQKNEKLRIALVVASPPGLPLVAYEPIQQALEKLAQEKTELIELLPVLHSAGLESIDEILSQKPHIVHFMGHCGLQDEQGKETGVIALVDPDSDQVLWVEAGNFSELLNQHRPGLVMLQASQSGRLSASQAFVGVASRVVQQNIPVVVAMQYDVSDTITSRFANRFYRQLAEGDPVDIAAQYGRRAISLSPAAQYEKRDFATPVIFMRVENGYLFQTYKEEPPAPSSSVEMRRRLEAAMPQTSQVGRPTEIRVMVALHGSRGLRATLPDVTESGDLINKNDAVRQDVALEFPVDSKTREPLPINIFVSITAPGFKIEQPAKSIRVSPKYDSGIITFFLTPSVSQKYGRVVIEWFSDEQKNTLLGSLTLITEVVKTQDQSTETPWMIEKLPLSLEVSEPFKTLDAESDLRIQQDMVSMEDADLVGGGSVVGFNFSFSQSSTTTPNRRFVDRVTRLPSEPSYSPTPPVEPINEQVSETETNNYEKTLDQILSISNEDELAKALIYLTAKLLPEEFSQALNAVQAMRDELNCFKVVSALIPNSPITLLPEIFQTILGLKDDSYRINLLISLAPYLPKGSLLQTLQTSQNNQDEFYRTNVLVTLTPYLSETLASEAFELALEIQSEPYRVKLLSTLIPYLPEALLPEVVKANQVIEHEFLQLKIEAALSFRSAKSPKEKHD